MSSSSSIYYFTSAHESQSITRLDPFILLGYTQQAYGLLTGCPSQVLHYAYAHVCLSACACLCGSVWECVAAATAAHGPYVVQILMRNSV